MHVNCYVHEKGLKFRLGIMHDHWLHTILKLIYLTLIRVNIIHDNMKRLKCLEYYRNLNK